jgi:hypothetical protein
VADGKMLTFINFRPTEDKGMLMKTPFLWVFPYPTEVKLFPVVIFPHQTARNYRRKDMSGIISQNK